MGAKLQQVQRLEQTAIPPLSQSRQADMACSLLYRARHVDHIEFETEAARRGIEIHRILAQYMDALRITKQQTDYKKMAELSADASPDEKEVLDRFTESTFYDHEKIYDTEMYVALDADFNLLDAHGRAKRDDPRVPGVIYEGMMDLVIMESEIEATIIDFKSYFQIVDADTFQSRMYPLLLFILNPQIQSIKFVLSFVRYGDAQRDVAWTRDDVPRLKKMVEWERARQVRLHSDDPEKMKPTPGRQCTWCPLLLSGCPVQKMNPYGNLDPADRVGFAVWINAAKKQNDQVIKDLVLENGPVEYLDANSVCYTAEFHRQDRRSYPVGVAFPILNQWFESHPGDRELAEKLTISGLSSPLKALKRAALKTCMEVVAKSKTITKLVIGRADEEADEDE